MLLRYIQKNIARLIRTIGLRAIMSLASKESALVVNGWFRSFKEQKSVDKDGTPIPWMTYPFIDFIQPRLSTTFKVFEYGCGNSTLFFARYVDSVISVEHDKEWLNEILKVVPDNVRIIYQPLDYNGKYSQIPDEQMTQFDIIIIDGRDRINCTKFLLRYSSALKSDGVIIFDNADRDEYEEAYVLLLKKGYKKIDFFGMGPIIQIKTCTSIFYKENNALGI